MKIMVRDMILIAWRLNGKKTNTPIPSDSGPHPSPYHSYIRLAAHRDPWQNVCRGWDECDVSVWECWERISGGWEKQVCRFFVWTNSLPVKFHGDHDSRSVSSPGFGIQPLDLGQEQKKEEEELGVLWSRGLLTDRNRGCAQTGQWARGWQTGYSSTSSIMQLIFYVWIQSWDGILWDQSKNMMLRHKGSFLPRVFFGILRRSFIRNVECLFSSLRWRGNKM